MAIVRLAGTWVGLSSCRPWVQVRSFWQWAAATCAALLTANAEISTPEMSFSLLTDDPAHGHDRVAANCAVLLTANAEISTHEMSLSLLPHDSAERDDRADDSEEDEED